MEAFLIYAGILLSLPFLVSNAPKSTVILLDSNRSTAVDVMTEAGTVTIDQPYHLTSLVSPNEKPAPVSAGDEEAIKKKYADLLQALPEKPVHMIFYFEQGAVELTESSKVLIAEMSKIVASREPAVIDIIGHSDRAGSDEQNYVLALKRAETLKLFLDQSHIAMERVNVLSYGENDPLIPTEDGVSEPRNRRVEVTIR